MEAQERNEWKDPNWFWVFVVAWVAYKRDEAAERRLAKLRGN